MRPQHVSALRSYFWFVTYFLRPSCQKAFRANFSELLAPWLTDFSTSDTSTLTMVIDMFQ